MLTARATIDKRGRLVLTKKIREAAGIEAGTPLAIRLGRDGRIVLEPAPLEATGRSDGFLRPARR